MPSNRVQIAIVVGLSALLAALDWVINGSSRTATVVAVAVTVGLVVRVTRNSRRRSDHS